MNQFFIYEFPEITGPIDAEIGRKLRERLGYYIRTVLLQVFQNMDMNKYRYGMKVPITDEEDDRKKHDNANSHSSHWKFR
jgi:hypothetical protein